MPHELNKGPLGVVSPVDTLFIGSVELLRSRQNIKVTRWIGGMYDFRA